MYYIYMFILFLCSKFLFEIFVCFCVFCTIFFNLFFGIFEFLPEFFIAPAKYTFQKYSPKKSFLKTFLFQNYSLKKYIFGKH